jgi:hypothetical protein
MFQEEKIIEALDKPALRKLNKKIHRESAIAQLMNADLEEEIVKGVPDEINKIKQDMAKLTSVLELVLNVGKRKHYLDSVYDANTTHEEKLLAMTKFLMAMKNRMDRVDRVIYKRYEKLFAFCKEHKIKLK